MKVITTKTSHTQTIQNKDLHKKKNKQMNIENLKRIMYEKKTRIPSLRN